MRKYPIHSDFKKFEMIKCNLTPLLLPFLNTLAAKRVNNMELIDGVTATKKVIQGYRNGTVKLTIYEPKEIENNAPCLIYLHGGAFALTAAPYHKNLACAYALRTPCKVVFADYRLAPRYPFPYGIEDCYAAFEWVCQNAQVLGIDQNRIAVGGDSAGGALAAAVSLMARDRKVTPVCFQMLIYPVTDARQTTETMKNYTDTPIWNSKLNEQMWKLYLKNGIPENREYASPMEAASFENLPDAYVEVSEFDCLRDEGIHYAETLRESGIPVELYQTAGTIHGFDMAETSEIVHQCVEKRIAALKKAFYSADH